MDFLHGPSVKSIFCCLQDKLNSKTTLQDAPHQLIRNIKTQLNSITSFQDVPHQPIRNIKPRGLVNTSLINQSRERERRVGRSTMASPYRKRPKRPNGERLGFGEMFVRGPLIHRAKVLFLKQPLAPGRLMRGDRRRQINNKKKRQKDNKTLVFFQHHTPRKEIKPEQNPASAWRFVKKTPKPHRCTAVALCQENPWCFVKKTPEPPVTKPKPADIPKRNVCLGATY